MTPENLLPLTDAEVLGRLQRALRDKMVLTWIRDKAPERSDENAGLAARKLLELLKRSNVVFYRRPEDPGFSTPTRTLLSDRA